MLIGMKIQILIFSTFSLYFFQSLMFPLASSIDIVNLWIIYNAATAYMQKEQHKAKILRRLQPGLILKKHSFIEHKLEVRIADPKWVIDKSVFK